MSWIIYLFIFSVFIIIPSVIIGFTTIRPQKHAFLSRENTTIYKGAAILCVILCHFMGTFGQAKTTLFTPLGSIGVAIFLTLSAYGLNESWNKSVQNDTGGDNLCWWRKRFLSVWIPYILVELICYWSIQPFEVIPFLLDITCIKPVYCFGWYLSYLFLWYVLFFVVRKIPFLNQHRIVVFLCLSVALFMTLREIKAEQSLSFFTGIILSEKKEINRFFNLKVGAALITFGIVFLAFKQLSVVREAPPLIYSLVQLFIKLPIALGLMLILWKLSSKVNLRVFGWLGVISYELYLIHGYLLPVYPISVMGAVVFVMTSVGLAVGLWLLLTKSAKWQRKILFME